MQGETEQYEKGLVSVVTPVFNGEAHVSRLLESVLNQTYPQVEMILADDGSEDATVSIAESYRARFAEKGYRYKIIQSDHRNASAALNHGLSYVRGEYLIWPDSDDWLTPESIEVRVRFLLENPSYYCVRSLASYADEKTGILTKPEERRGDLKKEELFWDILEGKTFVCCGCYMLKSRPFFDIYPQRKIPEYPVGQNFQMLLPFLYRHKCPTIEKELYQVIIRQGSASRRDVTEKEKQQRYEAFERLVDEIALICCIEDKVSQKRLLRWKLLRRWDLARSSGKRGEEWKVIWQLCKNGCISYHDYWRFFNHM